MNFLAMAQKTAKTRILLELIFLALFFGLLFFSGDAFAYSACLPSPNPPGLCDYTVSYSDLPSGQMGVSNAGLSKCDWAVFNYVGDWTPGTWGNPAGATIVNTKSGSVCSGADTITIDIGPNGVCRPVGSTTTPTGNPNSCYIIVGASDNSIPPNVFGTSYEIKTAPGTLVVALTVTPTTGDGDTLFSATAVISGTQIGTINYKFDCGEDGSGDYEKIVSATTATSYTAANVCQYSATNDYTIRVLVERGTSQATDTKVVTVNVDSAPPSVGKLYITGTQAQQTYPIQIQNGKTYTFKSDVSDNYGVANCSLFIPSDNGVMTLSSSPCPSCVASKAASFSALGTYSGFARCRDVNNNSRDGIPVQISVVDLSVDLTATPVRGTPIAKFSLKSKVAGGMTGTVNFHFDCNNDGSNNDGSWEAKYDGINLSLSDADWVSRTDFSGRSFSAKITAPDSFEVKDLCSYGSAGIYTAKTMVQRGEGGSAEDTVSITVDANSAPTPGFTCDASLCGAGASSALCIGYQGCVLSINNISSDPNGQTDIKTGSWKVKDKITQVIKEEVSCVANNPLCDYALPSTLPAGVYTIELTVGDLSDVSRTYSRDITLRRNLYADFVCSLDNSYWQACDSPNFRPLKKAKVYFRDNLEDNLLNSLGLSNKRTILSEDATRIVGREWKKDGVSFSAYEGCQGLNGCLNSNVFSNIEGTEIRLDVTDNSGRTAFITHEITTQLPAPGWEEIFPF